MAILLQKMAEYLRERCVSPKYAAEARLFPVSGAKARELGSPYVHDAIVVPYVYPFDCKMVHEKLVRFRYLGDPLPVDKSGKPVKFAQPKGSPVEAYFDPHLDWRRVAKDTNIPLHFVEGEIKALCMNQHGFVTIGLGGVDSFGGAELTEWLREVLK